MRLPQFAEALLRREPLDDVPEIPTSKGVSSWERSISSIAELERPAKFLAYGTSSSRRTPSFEVMSCQPEPPAGAILQLAPDTAIVSPELLALQMARIATHLELVLLICELCGLYAIQPNSPTGMIQRYRPLTTIDRILKFAESLNRTPGTAALRRACQDSFSCSGSPQESKLSIRCAWKRAAGGYGLSIVSLNEELEVGQIVGTSGTSRIRKPDLLFRRPSKEVPAICLDYKGRVHLDQGRPGADDARQNELIAAGMRPYTILSEQYQDMDYMDALIDGTIRRDLGLKTRSVTPRAGAARKAPQGGPSRRTQRHRRP